MESSNGMPIIHGQALQGLYRMMLGIRMVLQWFIYMFEAWWSEALRISTNSPGLGNVTPYESRRFVNVDVHQGLFWTRSSLDLGQIQILLKDLIVLKVSVHVLRKRRQRGLVRRLHGIGWDMLRRSVAKHETMKGGSRTPGPQPACFWHPRKESKGRGGDRTLFSSRIHIFLTTPKRLEGGGRPPPEQNP